MRLRSLIVSILFVLLLTSCNSVEVFRIDSEQNVHQIPVVEEVGEEQTLPVQAPSNDTVVSNNESDTLLIEDVQEQSVQSVPELSVPSSTRFIIAVADDSPVSDVILSSEVANTALSKRDSSKYSGKTSSAVFKELRQGDFDDKITLLISHGDAVIVDGGSDNALVDALEDSLDSYSVDFEVVSAADVDINDLKSLFE